MAFLNVARQTKSKFHLFSNQLWRCSSLSQVSRVVNRPFSSLPFMVGPNNRDSTTKTFQLEFFCNVRLFAAPAQAFQNKEEDTSGPRINEQITTQFVRLVHGEDHRVVSRLEALEMAKQLNLDLVEVDRVSKPPVCKIFDHNKEKFLRQMKEKERTKKKSEFKSGAFKEVRFSAKINKKDLQMKADMVKRLMDSGHRVKCTAIEPTEALDLPTLLSRFSALIRDVAYEESEPKVEKKQAFVVVRHIKFGPPKKKGSGSVSSKVAESTVNPSSKVASPLTISQTAKRTPLHENEGISETKHEGKSERLLDESEAIKSEWALFHGEDDFGAIFDMKGVVKGTAVDNQSELIDEKLPSLRRNSERVIESASFDRASFVPIETPKKEKENRYARDPRLGNTSKSHISLDRDPRYTISNISDIPDQGKQPQFNLNPSSQLRQHERLELHSPEISNQASSPSNVRFSSINPNGPTTRNRVDGSFQVPDQQNQQVNTSVSPQAPAYQVPMQGSSHLNIHNSPAKSYGIFSSQQTGSSPHERRLPAENNRYSGKNPSNSARN